MSLTREATTFYPGHVVGDIKFVGYDLSFTLHQLVSPESGWLLLNGATISAVTYPILYARFGSTLPDFTDGKVPVPAGLTNFTSWNTTGGEINHTLSSGELGVHRHPDTFSFTVDSHNHGNASFSISTAGDNHYHDNNLVAMGSPGVGSGGGFSGDTQNALASPSSSNNSGHGHTANTSVNSATSPDVSVGGSISATGSGGSHNNMQPYLVMGGWLVKHD